MGASDSKIKQGCKTIKGIAVEDVNFDLPGCLESLTDMAHTGKTQPLKRTSATSRALFGMSRALSAPVTASDRDGKANRPSLTRAKAVSLDTYNDEPACLLTPNRYSSGVSSSGGFIPPDIVEETESIESLDNELLDNISFQQHRASPSIEVIPPDITDKPLNDYDSDNDIISNDYDVLESELQHAMPQLALNLQYHKSSGSRLHVPGKSDKHSLLMEKRKKLLTKSNRVEEDTSEAFAMNKRHSNPQENDWEQIQEWMVWCIHKNLDDTSEDETSPCVTPVRKGRHMLQQQHSDIFPRGSSPTYRDSLLSAQHQFADYNKSSSSPLSTRNQYLPHQPRSIPADYIYRSNSYSSSPKISKSSPGSQPKVFGNNSSQQRSPVTRRTHNPRMMLSTGGARPKNRSLDNPLFKHSGQSSFESSGSSRMNSFDSTGTHNDKLL